MLRGSARRVAVADCPSMAQWGCGVGEDRPAYVKRNVRRAEAAQKRVTIRLDPRDRDSHVGCPLDLRLALREPAVPVGHAGILADYKADGPQIGGHLVPCPRADLRFTDQPVHQARNEPAMD